MGIIKTIVIATTIDIPNPNTVLALRKHGNLIDFHYRNLIFTVPEQVVFACKNQFNLVDQERFCDFTYNNDSYEELLAFYGLPTIEPEKPAYLVKKGEEHYLLYRFLAVNLAKKEIDKLKNYISFENNCPLRMPLQMTGKEKFLNKVKVLCRKFVCLSNNCIQGLEPLLSQRLSIDLCENIHIHFQNFRLEFSVQEFIEIRDAFSAFEWKLLLTKDDFYIQLATLPLETEWNSRLQLEEQAEGHYHLHYRNLRVEFRSFNEIGLKAYLPNNFNIDQDFKEYYEQNFNFRFLGIRSIQLSELKCAVYRSDGIIEVPIEESPIYKAISTENETIYDEYINIVKGYDPECRYSWSRLQEVTESIRKNGYQESNLIVIRGTTKRIDDGQHRACTLFALYGGSHVVKVAHYE